MATLSLFYGILITMRPEEGERHKKPHIHARHAGRQGRPPLTSHRARGWPGSSTATTR